MCRSSKGNREKKNDFTKININSITRKNDTAIY